MRKTLLTTSAIALATMPAAFAAKGTVPTPDPAAANPAPTGDANPGTEPTAPATAATAETAKAERVAPVLTGAFKIDLPARANKRGSTSVYPFDTLTEIGMAFGVKNKTAAGLSSIISNANRKALEPVKDDAGNAMFETKELVDAAGNKTAVPDVSKPKMRATKRFVAVDVTPEIAASIKGTPLDGSTVLVQRIALA